MCVDDLIKWIEDNGYDWDVGNTGRNVEARMWKWPSVIGRYRATKTEPLYNMLIAALADGGIEID